MVKRLAIEVGWARQRHWEDDVHVACLWTGPGLGGFGFRGLGVLGVLGA